MKKESIFFEKEGIKLHFTVSGQGKKTLLVFHGFGQTQAVFDNLRTCFDEEFTIYCFDLFFHGHSSWLNHSSFTQKDWLNFFDSFFREKNIDTFSLLTFSLGTRFGLSLYEKMPEKVEEIWLIAPEGLTLHWVYRVITGYKATRFLFRYTIVHPEYFLNTIFVLSKIKLLPLRGYRFLVMMMRTHEHRLQLYKTWIVLRKLVYDTPKIIQHLNQHQTKLTVFASSKDYIVPFSFVKNFLKKVHHFELKKYQVAHFRLIDEVTKYFQQP